MVQTKISEAGAMFRPSGVGPLHEHSATMRAYISEMRRRYISMWQLGLIAGILQLLLYLFAAQSLSADFQLAAAEGKYACALLVLAPWRAPVPLTRAWCIWEVFCTVDTDTELRVLLPAAERDAFATALVDDFDSIVQVVCAVDVEKAEAHSDTDRDNIFAAVRETCGFHKLNVASAGGLRGALAHAGATWSRRVSRAHA